MQQLLYRVGWRFQDVADKVNFRQTGADRCKSRRLISVTSSSAVMRAILRQQIEMQRQHIGAVWCRDKQARVRNVNGRI
jgi:hypothetical protein